MCALRVACSNGILFIVATALTACGSEGSIEVPPEEVTVFHFKMQGDVTGVQDFRAAATDATLIAAVREELGRPENERSVHINGPIGRGNDGHNLAWNWHFVPDEWTLAEFSIEVCDGNAVMVSQAVDYWVDTVGQFCPWSSFVASEVSR